jgi:hypothetical protein
MPDVNRLTIHIIAAVAESVALSSRCHRNSIPPFAKPT